MMSLVVGLTFGTYFGSFGLALSQIRGCFVDEIGQLTIVGSLFAARNLAGSWRQTP